MEASSPTNVSQLRSFLGLLTYYARFVSNLANKLKQLHELLNKTTTWKWTDKCETVFKEVKTGLAKSEPLAHLTQSYQSSWHVMPHFMGWVRSCLTSCHLEKRDQLPLHQGD